MSNKAQYQTIITRLNALANPVNVAGMARFGISPHNNYALNQKTIALAQEIQKLDSSTARWIAADAIRELTGAPVQSRLKDRPVGVK